MQPISDAVVRPKQAVRQQRQQPLLIQQVDNRKTVSTSCCHHRTAAARSPHLPALDWRGRWVGGKTAALCGRISHGQHVVAAPNFLLHAQHVIVITHIIFYGDIFTRFGGNVVCVGETAVSTYTCIRVDSFCSVGLQFGLKLFSFFVSRNILNSPKVVFCILSFCLMHYFSNVFSVVILCLFFFIFMD